MKQIVDTLTSIWNSRQVRDKLFATLALTVLFRFLAHVPLFGVDITQLQQLFQTNNLLGVLNLFSGGTLANFSLMAVGIGPYITASILVQISGVFFPKVKEMQRESEATRAQLTQITRLLTVPAAILQSVSLLFLLRSQNLLLASTPLEFIAMIASLVAGAVVVMWVGELITRYGVGNGISWIIFIGIVSQIPVSITQTWALRDTINSATLWAMLFGLAAIMVSVVYMNEAVRRIPIQQARRQRGSNVYGGSMSHIPIKVTQFGVMPIIFALPVLALPSTVATLLLNVQNMPGAVVAAARVMQVWFNPASTVYNVLYFVLVFAFTFFSIFVYFQPQEFADDLKKSGAYVPGVRPGKPTAKLLMRVLLRVSFIGGLYLGVVAILPLIAQSATGINTLTVGGTGLLIVVSVVLDTVRQVQSQLVHDQYDRYL